MRSFRQAAALFITSAALLSSCASGSEAGGSSGSSEKEFGAFEICKEFVKDRLKSPSSAEFRNFFEDDGEVRVTGTGDGPYTVISSVDSDNSFGASLRNQFSCTVTNTGGENWRLSDLQLGDSVAEPGANGEQAEADSTSETTLPPTTIAKAVLQAEAEAEIQRACNDAQFFDSEPKINYEDRWESTRYSETSMLEAAKKCFLASRTPGDKEVPLGIGATAKVGVWEATVTEVVPDATKEIVQLNSTNPLPSNGQYMKVSVRLTLKDALRSIAPSVEVEVGLLGTDGGKYRATCGYLMPQEYYDSVDQGGSVTMTLCIDAKPDVVTGGKIYVQDKLMGERYQTPESPPVYWVVP